jgi:hypothetical protein
MSRSATPPSPLAGITKPGKPGKPVVSTKPGKQPAPAPKKGGGGPKAAAKFVSVTLDVTTAQTLLTALALALGSPVDKKKGKK